VLRLARFMLVGCAATNMLFLRRGGCAIATGPFEPKRKSLIAAIGAAQQPGLFDTLALFSRDARPIGTDLAHSFDLALLWLKGNPPGKLQQPAPDTLAEPAAACTSSQPLQPERQLAGIMHLQRGAAGRGGAAAAAATARSIRRGAAASSIHRPAAAAAGRRRLTVVAAVRAKSKRQICCSKTLVARPETADEVARMCAEVTEFSQKQIGDKAAGVNTFDCVRDQWEVRGALQGGGIRLIPATASRRLSLVGCMHVAVACLHISSPNRTQRSTAMCTWIPLPHTHTAQPNVFHFWERYESNLALGRHNTAPELAGFMEKVRGRFDGCEAAWV
jgi:hypothetical protein